MTQQADIQFASGAVHDDIGPITSFLPITDKGRHWLQNTWGADLSSGAAFVETEYAELVAMAAEADGVTVACVS